MMIYNHVLFINITFLFLELTLVLQYCANHNSVFFYLLIFRWWSVASRKKKTKSTRFKNYVIWVVLSFKWIFGDPSFFLIFLFCCSILSKNFVSFTWYAVPIILLNAFKVSKDCYVQVLLLKGAGKSLLFHLKNLFISEGVIVLGDFQKIPEGIKVNVDLYNN